MKIVDPKNYPDCRFGRNVIIKAAALHIGEGVVFGDNVWLEADDMHIGHGCTIESNVRIKGLHGPMELLYLGDQSFVGFSNQILMPVFVMRDYSQLHNSGLHNGYMPLIIGFNCWIGQNTILNSAERLVIHNNVRIGPFSQLWTHIASGEVLEGCNRHGNKPIFIKDNVWLLGGSSIISPGLTVENNTVIMPGSVLTKSTESFNTYGGSPALNLTEKINFWNKVTIDDKYEMMGRFVDEFLQANPEYHDKVHLVESTDDLNNLNHKQNAVIIAKCVESFDSIMRCPSSVFDLSSKMYFKKRTPIEIAFIMFNIGYRARFVPYNDPDQGALTLFLQSYDIQI